MESTFSEARVRHLKSMDFDGLQSLEVDDFTVSEITHLISETPMRDEDKRMCVSLFIKKKTLQEIADETGFSVERIKQKKKELKRFMIYTIIKLFYEYDDAHEGEE